jgi:outer membrane protein, multidrug efflux system
LPIFDGGRREAGVQQARAALAEAHARYRSQVLTALREVDDQLVALQTLNEQARVQAVAVGAAARASALSSTRWRNGLVSQLELLDAQRSELRYRRAALQVDAAREQSTVALVRALGGGWAPQMIMASSGQRKE